MGGVYKGRAAAAVGDVAAIHNLKEREGESERERERILETYL